MVNRETHSFVRSSTNSPAKPGLNVDRRKSDNGEVDFDDGMDDAAEEALEEGASEDGDAAAECVSAPETLVALKLPEFGFEADSCCDKSSESTLQSLSGCQMLESHLED